MLRVLLSEGLCTYGPLSIGFWIYIGRFAKKKTAKRGIISIYLRGSARGNRDRPATLRPPLPFLDASPAARGRARGDPEGGGDESNERDPHSPTPRARPDGDKRAETDVG